MNVCVFTGRPTKDIEIVTKNDKTTAFFSLAVSSGYGANKKTSFFNCVAYGKLAKSIEKNVKKGTKITIEAAARQKKFKDAKGNNRSSIDFVIKSWEYAESKGKKSYFMEPVAYDAYEDVEGYTA